MDNFESIRITMFIPINSENYINQILKFDECFITNGAKYGIYYFIPKEMIQKGLFVQYLEIYLKYKSMILTSCEYEFINLSDMYLGQNILNLAEKGSLIQMIDIPIFENNKWKQKGFKIPIDGSNFPLLEISPFFCEKVDFAKNSENHLLDLSISSTSNIWYDEFEYSDINGELIHFENMYNNRPIAYRIVPRFNSFIRELKKMVDSLGGETTVEDDMNHLNKEGYMLLDGMVFFQEDIESGLVKLPD